VATVEDVDEAMVSLLMLPGAVPVVTLEDLLHRPTWHAQAACRDAGPEAFFLHRGQSPGPGLALCQGCEVRAQCLAFALDDPEVEGTWGGTTVRQRQGLRRAAS
jgi:WhiB family redox-sensing transcriptional regulator